jgi:signal transduction histidine kinase
LKDPQLKEMIHDIHESSIRLIELVNDFLDTSRLEQGKIDFKIAPFEMETVIEECLKEYQTTGSEKKLYLNYVRPDKKLPLVSADRNRTKQVIINLIGNALKFTEVGGVTIETIVEGNFIQTAIKDTGRGMSPQNQQLLFRKFQQAGNSIFTRDSTKGTGLGLYISKLIISGLKGSIGLLNSEEGKGSTFAFTLPLAEENQPS